jgi:hypothetical protein
MLVLIIFFFSYSNHIAQENEEPSDIENSGHSYYYEDIDIFQLKGVKRLNEIVYPCIEIKSFRDKKEITYHPKAGSAISKKYVKGDGFWFSTSESKGDTSMIYSYEFIVPSKVITFMYSDKTTFQLLEASKKTADKEVIFFPIGKPLLKPKIKNFELAVKNAGSQYLKEIVNRGTYILEHTKKFNKNGYIHYEYNNCFKSNFHSYTWWEYFGWIYAVKIECK